jgi:CPA2 family monovalent cation:H+ antiporter-2
MSAALAWVLGTPTRTAVLAGAVLAQSAEFSFLLARVGRDVEAVSATVYSLMLAAAAASIVLLPSVHTASLPLAAGLHARRPAFREEDEPVEVRETTDTLRNHAVICGFGRVGAVIGRVLRNRFTFVAIEEDPRIVQQLRAHGIPVIRGNAGVPAVLAQAHLERARELVVALPDPVVTRQVVDMARQINPRLRMIVRTHSEAERQWLVRRGVDSVILGEWELALEMALHALRGFGMSTMESDAIVQRLRGRTDLDQVRGEVTGPVRAASSVREPAPRPKAEPGATVPEPPPRRLHDGVRFRPEPPRVVEPRVLPGDGETPDHADDGQTPEPAGEAPESEPSTPNR